MTIKKITFILATVSLATCGFLSFVFAQDSSGEQKLQSSSLSPEIISQKMPSFTSNLQKYISEAERNIKKIDERMRKEGILSGGGEGERQAMFYTEMGDVAYKNGQLQDAIDQWQQAYILTKMPQLKKSLRKAEDSARSELKRENQAEQRMLQKNGKDNSTSDMESYICKNGIKLYNEGDYSEALVEFNKVLLINPNNKIAKKYVQTIFLKNKNEPPEKKNISKDTYEPQFVSKSEEYVCSMGVVYYDRGEYADAKSEFEKALIINPNSKMARDYLNRIANPQAYQKSQNTSGQGSKSGPFESVSKFIQSLF